MRLKCVLYTAKKSVKKWEDGGSKFLGESTILIELEIGKKFHIMCYYIKIKFNV